MTHDDLEVCCLCGRPIPAKWQGNAIPMTDGWAHPGCARKAQGRPPR